MLLLDLLLLSKLGMNFLKALDYLLLEVDEGLDFIDLAEGLSLLLLRLFVLVNFDLFTQNKVHGCEPLISLMLAVEIELKRPLVGIDHDRLTIIFVTTGDAIASLHRHYIDNMDELGVSGNQKL